MSEPGGLRGLWQRYLVWRQGEGVTMPPEPERAPNKVDADEGDVIREKYSNRGGGWSSGA